MIEPLSSEELLADFPQTIELKSGETLDIRPAEKQDNKSIVQFAKLLNETDLLFLRVDITQTAAVNNWLANIERGHTISLLAVRGSDVVGYATVDRNQARWTRRVGEIRVNVAPEYRSQGLGRQLIAMIFDIASSLGLRKLIANMTPDQTGAQAAFSRLGFRSEALLADFVEDRHGNVHDMAIMSYDIDGLSDTALEPLSL
jgi:L-amino acid N-acyltransferase YncA